MSKKYCSHHHNLLRSQRKIPGSKKKTILSCAARKIISKHIKQQNQVVKQKIANITQKFERLEKMFALELFNHHRKLNYVEEQQAILQNDIFLLNLKILSLLSVEFEREKELSKNNSCSEIFNSLLERLKLLRDVRIQPEKTAETTTTKTDNSLGNENNDKKMLYIVNKSNRCYPICISCYTNLIYNIYTSMICCQVCKLCVNLLPTDV